MTTPFSAWKEGAKFYAPVLTLGFAVLVLWWPAPVALFAGGPLVLAGLAIVYFFRDPLRAAQAGPHDMLSPADGTVVGIEELPQTPYYDGPCKRISIFLSVLSVHVNRAPFDGTVRKVEYRPGQFVNAMKSASSDCNEANAVWMDTAHGLVTVRQVAGWVARRIVCKTAPGGMLARGERFGMIRFGSRTELYVPVDTEVCVTLRDAVRGGLSVVARFPGGAGERP